MLYFLHFGCPDQCLGHYLREREEEKEGEREELAEEGEKRREKNSWSLTLTSLMLSRTRSLWCSGSAWLPPRPSALEPNERDTLQDSCREWGLWGERGLDRWRGIGWIQSRVRYNHANPDWQLHLTHTDTGTHHWNVAKNSKPPRTHEPDGHCFLPTLPPSLWCRRVQSLIRKQGPCSVRILTDFCKDENRTLFKTHTLQPQQGCRHHPLDVEWPDTIEI